MPEPRERGIPFSTAMVRAERAGLKTQTRRVITPRWARCLDLDDPDDRTKAIEQCPYGVVGDRLYVREPLRPVPGFKGGPEIAAYDAVDPITDRRDTVKDSAGHVRWGWKARYIASRYCPKWAARTWLEIVEVRVERIQDITEDDARAEGPPPNHELEECATGSHRIDFAALWDSINEARGYGWDANPWVFVIVFRRVS